MNIGEFNMKKGRLLGFIATHSIDLPRLGLRPVESENELAPIYEIVAFNVGGRWVQVGALWEAVSKKGEVFYQGNIDDPSLPEALPIALFGTDSEGYRVAWRRQERRDDFGPANRSSTRRETPTGNGEDYGFGGSTADDSGRLATESAGADLDDEIQF